MKSVAKLIQKFGVRTGYIDSGDVLKAMQKSKDGKVISLIRQGVNLNNRGLKDKTPMLSLLRGTRKVPFKYLPMLLFAGSELFPTEKYSIDAYDELTTMGDSSCTPINEHFLVTVTVLLHTPMTELNKERHSPSSKYLFKARDRLKRMFITESSGLHTKLIKKALKFYDTMHASIKTAQEARKDKQYEQAALHFIKAADQVKTISGLLDGSLKEPEFKAYFAQKEIELLLPSAQCAEGLKSTPTALAGLSKRIATQMKIVEGTLVSQVLALKKGAKPKPTASCAAAKYTPEDEELLALLPKAHDCK